MQEGTLLWQASDDDRARSGMAHYMRWLSRERGQHYATYDELYRWSVAEPEAFWQSIWTYFNVQSHTPYTSVLAAGGMPGARWFSGATLNYAEHALARQLFGPASGDSGAPHLRSDEALAVVAVAEGGERVTLSFGALLDQVARARAGLRRLGVTQGDRVAAVLPNGVEALVAFLATASLGAIWSSSSPEFGVQSVLDRFRQIEPKVLLVVDGYRYGGKWFDRRDAQRETAAGLPSLVKTVVVAHEGSSTDAPLAAGQTSEQSGSGNAPAFDAISYAALTAVHEPLVFEAVPFDHPLWILYSSGTTGLPKPIVHGHGGILIEHLKAVSLHCDLGPSDRFFWFTTTGWMMWNFLVSGLLVGAAVVLYDGSPGHPDLLELFRLADQEGVTYFGTSAPYLLACQKAGVVPKKECDLSRLRGVGTTGAPLPVDGFAWVYENVSSEILLGSVSGGTDVCTAFVLSCPLLPVHAGEIQCCGLGAAIAAFDGAGRSVHGEVGELVLTAPFPSMPLYLWGDTDGRRMHDSYFDTYPGVWRHGDWIKITQRNSVVIYGRSDSTLNRGGVRMGTSEFYRVVEAIPDVSDSVVVDTGSLQETDGKLLLFVVPRSGTALSAELVQSIRSAIRTELSPRHVPDQILEISQVPRTLNGKKLEVPLKRILAGVRPEQAVSLDTLKNPEALKPFIRYAQTGTLS